MVELVIESNKDAAKLAEILIANDYKVYAQFNVARKGNVIQVHGVHPTRDIISPGPEPDFVQFNGDNLFCEPISADAALRVLADFFLGENFYIVDPVSPGQANTILTDNIIRQYPRRYRKFCKKRKWRSEEFKKVGLFK